MPTLIDPQKILHWARKPLPYKILGNDWRTGTMHAKENLSTVSIPFLEENVFLHVISVEYVGDYKLRLTFSNHVQGIVDLEPELYGEIFEPLKDQALFQQVVVTSRTLEWPNGADFAPEFLFQIAQDKQWIHNVGHDG